MYFITDHGIRNCTFRYFLEILSKVLRGTCFFKKIFSKSSDIYFFYPKTSNFRNLGLFGRRKLPNSLMNNIFDVLWISLQYTLSFKWLHFGLKCLVTITPKGQSLKFKASLWNFPISETSRNSNSLFKLVDNNLVIIMQQRKKERNWACTLVMHFWHVLWACPDSLFEKSFAKHPFNSEKNLMSDRFLLKLFVFDVFSCWSFGI